jgi:hypothetical protein
MGRIIQCVGRAIQRSRGDGRGGRHQREYTPAFIGEPDMPDDYAELPTGSDIFQERVKVQRGATTQILRMIV